ncbi:hypothetical protein MA16_Dca003786 [Dendrobium catenatum]|uniref:Uncharacterized protein n=1 Tax=Dendrobium catenatum TaxID=906689 RepID=A0A2I0W5R4_9ASPA|nr:hypothetical protein MA16_Dca020990 [Dendrobium catenatum]PKU74583.1 hypothetical protein MA16_Dca003786 [Dendrobium catenatum]
MGAGGASRPEAEWLWLVRCSARGADRCRPTRRQEPGRSMLEEAPSGRSANTARANKASFWGSCVPVATARGLPIRPVLKHGPRSLTCVRVDGC